MSRCARLSWVLYKPSLCWKSYGHARVLALLLSDSFGGVAHVLVMIYRFVGVLCILFVQSRSARWDVMNGRRCTLSLRPKLMVMFAFAVNLFHAEEDTMP